MKMPVNDRIARTTAPQKPTVWCRLRESAKPRRKPNAPRPQPARRPPQIDAAQRRDQHRDADDADDLAAAVFAQRQRLVEAVQPAEIAPGRGVEHAARWADRDRRAGTARRRARTKTTTGRPRRRGSGSRWRARRRRSPAQRASRTRTSAARPARRRSRSAADSAAHRSRDRRRECCRTCRAARRPRPA